MATQAWNPNPAIVALVCPECCNDATGAGQEWLVNGPTPFRLVEDVTRSWTLTARCEDAEGLILMVDTDRDRVDWENGTNRRVECVQCLTHFPLPFGAVVRFV
jgi:hypothetical protein